MTQVDLGVIGQKSEESVFEYDWSDVVLYNLGVGASEKDLSFVFEDAPGGLKVLPSFCVVPAVRAFPYLGDDMDPSLMLHGEQIIKLYRPFPASGKLIQVGECTDIFDKGKGAVFHVKIEGRTEDGERLYDAKWAIFYLGAGGFGGNPGPKAEKIEPPAGVAPDFIISDKVADNQAAIYRLSGDLNPLHLVPEAANRGGFDQPILHGLCTYGFATRAIVSGPLEGDVDRLKEFSARFSNPVYPGDTLTTQGWKIDGGYIIRVMSGERVVLTNAMAVVDGM